MSIHDNRLTRDDYAAIDQRLGEQLDNLRHSSPNYRPQAWEWERAAWHAIGCDSRDLRDVELALIDQQVTAICDHAYLEWEKRAGVR